MPYILLSLAVIAVGLLGLFLWAQHHQSKRLCEALAQLKTAMDQHPERFALALRRPVRRAAPQPEPEAEQVATEEQPRRSGNFRLPQRSWRSVRAKQEPKLNTKIQAGARLAAELKGHVPPNTASPLRRSPL
jgi:hypothetical protein